VLDGGTTEEYQTKLIVSRFSSGCSRFLIGGVCGARGAQGLPTEERENSRTTTSSEQQCGHENKCSLQQQCLSRDVVYHCVSNCSLSHDVVSHAIEG
jgi:hypothetical protein